MSRAKDAWHGRRLIGGATAYQCGVERSGAGDMKQAVSMMIAAFAASSLFAQPAPVPLAPPTAAPESIRAHVQFLADDAREGREAGTKGHKAAADYVWRQMVSAGIAGGAGDGSFFQPVRLREFALTDKGSSLTLTGPNGSKTWRNATSVVVGPDRFEAERAVEAPTVFVGWGIDAPAQGFDDFRDLDVQGKIVVSFFGVPKGSPSEIGAHLSTQKARMAAARGAIGMIELGTLVEEEIAPWREVVPYATLPFMSWVGSDGRAYSSAPKLQVSSGIDTPAAEWLFAGAPKSFSQLRAQADEPNAKLPGFALPSRARIERSTRFRDLTSPNVIGMIKGTDPALKDEYVVLMAHLDHEGVRARQAGDNIYNGAMDNAAGVATLLEAGRELMRQRTKRSVLLIAVTAEEKGQLGADYFAHYPTVPLDQIVGVINLDMPLMTYSFTDIIAFGAEASTMGRSVHNAAAAMGVTVSPDPEPEQRIFARSDHYALVKKGVPAIFLRPGLANGGAAAWKTFRADHYHKPSDDLKQPIDWVAGARFARLNTAIIREIADAPERPSWYSGNFFGDTFAPAARKRRRGDRTRN